MMKSLTGFLERRLSALVLGLGNMLNGQLIKGLLFLAGELAYLWFKIGRASCRERV